jgi:chitodextrinase
MRDRRLGVMIRILLAFVFALLFSWSNAYAVEIYVSVSGNDSNSGTASLPLKTVGKAVEMAKMHNADNEPVTITLLEGTYREAVEWNSSGTTTDAPIVFQALPLKSAIISGSDIYTDWVAESQPNLYSHSWDKNWGVPGDLGESSGEVARRREMVFIDGELLTQVTSFNVLTDNSFYVDDAAKKLYIQTTSDPNESSVEVGVRQGIFKVNQLKNLTVKGIVFQHDTTPADKWAVIFRGVENVLVEDCDFVWNTWGGLRFESGNNVTIRRIKANHNGGKGTEVFRTTNLLFEDSEMSYNNWRGFAGGFTGWSVAGSKHLRIHGAVYRNLIAIDNKARGFWLDFDSQDIVFDGLIALGNIEGGLGVEANQGPITIRNSVICNTTVFGGILASNSENITLENSVLGHNQTGQIRPRGTKGRDVDNWETGEVVPLFSKNWTANNNIIFGSGKNELLWYYADSGGDLFLSTYQGDNNIYWNTSPDVFRLQGDNDFSTWQQITGQEQNSILTDPTKADLTDEQRRMLDICLGLIPPTPPAVAVDAITHDSAEIRWSTSELTDSRVEYGPTELYGSTSALDPSLVFDHRVLLTGLSPETTYHFRVISNNQSGSSFISEDSTFTTTQFTDNSPPSVPSVLTAIVISGSQINLSWGASTDNVGVTGYRIYRDGSIITTTGDTYYSDTGLAQSTRYTYTVIALDAAGNESEHSKQAEATTNIDSSGLPPEAPSNLEVNVPKN